MVESCGRIGKIDENGHLQFTQMVINQTNLLQYYNGPLLSGKISINLIWYGKFNPTRRTIISEVIISLLLPHLKPNPLLQPGGRQPRKEMHFSLVRKLGK
ncbi:Protein EXORDIUM [Camellia lanceoleosa]|uniref:Protein EXORDIUM n=1 Tax=Camellia lanceoleosa TaxID=1840588 RepID=A0ACC0GCQ1_9ERIC|nr:Protein EXORDIUM [Camellia lanceoleosa]